MSSLLQSVTRVITKCDSFFFITNCDTCYYIVRQVLQSATEQGVGWVGAAISPAVQKSREKTDSAMRHGKDTSFPRHHALAVSSWDEVGVTYLTRSCAIQWVSRSTLSARKENRKGINPFPFTSVSHVSTLYLADVTITWPAEPREAWRKRPTVWN